MRVEQCRYTNDQDAKATLETLANIAGGNLPILEKRNRMALVTYIRLHNNRIRDFSGAWEVAYQQLLINVSSCAEAAYFQRAWDQIHLAISAIAIEELRRTHKQQ